MEAMVQKKAEPAMAWLKVTDYMHGWLEWELGGEVIVYGKRLVSIQHLHGARGVLRMPVSEDTMEQGSAGKSMSVTRRNCIEAGLQLDAEATKALYGATRETLAQFVPIECPGMCMTKRGVLRPWTWDVTFGHQQASALQNLLRREFWAAVERFDRQFSEARGGRWYAAKEMIEAWCAATRTSDIYTDEIRREWQRRKKRVHSA